MHIPLVYKYIISAAIPSKLDFKRRNNTPYNHLKIQFNKYILIK